MSLIETAALLAPVAEGWNLTLMVQLAAAATLEPQLFASVKSTAFVPVTVILLTVSDVVPWLLSVTRWVLLVPTD